VRAKKYFRSVAAAPHRFRELGRTLMLEPLPHGRAHGLFYLPDQARRLLDPGAGLGAHMHHAAETHGLFGCWHPGNLTTRKLLSAPFVYETAVRIKNTTVPLLLESEGGALPGTTTFSMVSNAASNTNGYVIRPFVSSFLLQSLNFPDLRVTAPEFSAARME
jgi:hypothetical protein